MSLKARRELLLAIRPQYQKTRWGEKCRLLDGFLVATGYSRKHAVSLLNGKGAPANNERQRSRQYDDPVRQALLFVSKAANRICSKRLIPFLPGIVASLKKFGHLSLLPDVRKQLLCMSPATADRLLKDERGKYSKSTTRPGYLIKRQIAVRTFSDWNETTPGFLEADLVAYCGETVRGQFLHTLTMTDIATGWTECAALVRRSEVDVMKAMMKVRELLPFPLRGLNQRVVAAADLPEEKKNSLLRMYEQLDPVQLLFEVERLQTELWKTAVGYANVSLEPIRFKSGMRTREGMLECQRSRL